MSEFQANMFNKKAANPKNRPDQILNAIGLKRGQHIADIGSGGGYFSLRFAEIVGEEGKVYAVDAKRQYLDYIKRSAEEKGLRNLMVVSVSEGGLQLPKNVLDVIFMRNVAHHISDRIAYFEGLRSHLKSGGRVVVIEYKRGTSISFRSLFGHHVPKEIIVREMGEAGYALEKEFDFLPEQHFSIFKAVR